MSVPFNSTPTGARPDNFRTTLVQLDRPGDPSVFSDQVRVDALEIISRYPEGQSRSALLPMLHLVQSEQGYVTPDGIAFCADVLGLTKAQVVAVSTFYTMYKRKPTGEYLVSVCTNTLCGMLGGDEIYKSLSEALGVGMNETTDDGKVTLEHAECLAACDFAPVVTVNYEFFDNQTVESAAGLVEQLRAGQRPLPTRGAPLCSFREIERQIAGFFDEQDLALDSVSGGAGTEVGVRLATERGDTAPSYANATSSGSATADSSGAGAGLGQPTSANDAPLKTAESDPANSAGPAAPGQEKGTGA
jgi:NADH-quinone oxidoreductase subunit E